MSWPLVFHCQPRNLTEKGERFALWTENISETVARQLNMNLHITSQPIKGRKCLWDKNASRTETAWPLIKNNIWKAKKQTFKRKMKLSDGLLAWPHNGLSEQSADLIPQSTPPSTMSSRRWRGFYVCLQRNSRLNDNPKDMPVKSIWKWKVVLLLLR